MAAAVVGVVAALTLVAAVAMQALGNLGAGVSGATGRPTGAAAAAISPTPTAKAPASPARTPQPSIAPTGPGEFTVAESKIGPWVDRFGEVRAQVLVDLVNTGGSPAAIPSAGVPYRIRSSRGETVVTGRFAYAFPPIVEPGGRGWLIDTISATFAEPEDLASLEVELASPGTIPPAPRTTELAVDDLRWEAVSTGGVRVTGTIRNVGSSRASRAVIGVMLRASDGTPLAGVYDVRTVTDLAPGETTMFSTDYPTTAPIDLAEVATADAVAVALD